MLLHAKYKKFLTFATISNGNSLPEILNPLRDIFLATPMAVMYMHCLLLHECVFGKSQTSIIIGKKITFILLSLNTHAGCKTEENRREAITTLQKSVYQRLPWASSLE